MGAPMGGSPYGAPMDAGGQPGGYGAPAAMTPYGQPGLAGPAPGAPIQPGVHGPKGQVRSGMMALVWSFVSCGFYQLWWFIVTCNEMSTYLQREEPSWWKILLFSSLTCGIYSLYWQIARCGVLVQEMQQRAGLPNPQNHGFMYLVPYYNVILLQEELNKVWQSPQ
jgi:hypothetical protein